MSLTIFLLLIALISVAQCYHGGSRNNNFSSFQSTSEVFRSQLEDLERTKSSTTSEEDQSDDIEEEEMFQGDQPRNTDPSNDSERFIEDQCCERQKKMVVVGQGEMNEEISVDVGRCRKTCLRHPHRSNLRRGNSNIWQDEIDIQLSRSLGSCGYSGSCEPVAVRRETHHLITGPQTVQVVTDCSCKPKPDFCQRLERRHVFFPNSPYETEVDVGSCKGHCTTEKSCKSVQNRTVSVEGPNGAVCVDVIERCSCQSSCYRMHKWEVYYDSKGNDSNSTERQVKKIDVGRCVGDCTSGSLYQCVLRDKSNSSVCLMSLAKRQPICVPIGFATHTLQLPANGQDISILAVTECGCK